MVSRRNVFPEVAPVVTTRAFEHVCSQIRQLIADGSLKPGDKLPPERELAARFCVSRGVVREALRTLEVAGLLELRKGGSGGAFVVHEQLRMLNQVFRDMMHFGTFSLAHLTEARQKIVKIAVELACERATEEDFAAIEANIDRTEIVVKRHNLQSMIPERAELASEFYHLLGLSSKNEVIGMVIDTLTSMLLQFTANRAEGPILRLVESRRRFFKHFRARDAVRASKEIIIFLSALQYTILSSADGVDDIIR